MQQTIQNYQISWHIELNSWHFANHMLKGFFFHENVCIFIQISLDYVQAPSDNGNEQTTNHYLLNKLRDVILRHKATLFREKFYAYGSISSNSSKASKSHHK